MDVQSDKRRIEREQVDLPNGHWVEESFEALGVLSHANQNFYFERTFDFNCVVQPTSFSFRVTFSGTVSDGMKCVSVIRRTDNRAGSVKVQFCSELNTDPSRSDVPFAPHCISAMAPGTVDRQVFAPVLPKGNASEFIGKIVKMQFYLIVHRCHSAQDTTKIHRCHSAQDTTKIHRCHSAQDTTKINKEDQGHQ